MSELKYYLLIISVIASTCSGDGRCGINEVWNDCGTCDRTCKAPNPTCLYIKMCRKGCFCKSGYVRENGICIPKNMCPIICTGENYEYNECGSACPKTCDNIDKDIRCPDVCVKGCFCKPGFVLNAAKECVLPEDCELKCGKNEIWKRCGTCDRTCKNLNPGCLYLKICRRGCYCKPGFVRHNGNCIPKNKCPVLCKGKNFEYKECGSACPASCDTLGVDIACPEICVEGCFCKEGYVLNSAKECVLPEECDCSDPNAELIACANSCSGGTCAQPHFSGCRRGCHPWACQCMEGFVKLSETDKTCVEIESCP